MSPTDPKTPPQPPTWQQPNPSQGGDPDKPAEQDQHKDSPPHDDRADLLAELKKIRESDKATKAELEKLRASTMSEQEKAVAAAKTEGAREAALTAGRRLAAAEFRAAAAGRLSDAGAALELIDLARFVGDDGEPDTKAIAAAVDKIAAAAALPVNGKTPLVPAGVRGTAPTADVDWLGDAIRAGRT